MEPISNIEKDIGPLSVPNIKGEQIKERVMHEWPM